VPPGATAIPDVSGKSVQAAISVLKNSGFKNITTGRQVASLTVSQGDVVRTRPPKGKVEPLNTPIVLLVSGGGVKVPQLVGISESEAIGRLARAGLFPHVITRQGPLGTPPSIVWKSTPGAGKVLLPNRSVTIYVSPQPSPTPTSTSPSPSPSSTPSPTTTPSPSTS